MPPHDKGIIDRVMNCGEIVRADFDQAVADGKIVFCEEEVDKAFIEAVVAQSTPGPRDLKVLYSPLHGVGATAVVPALDGAGFKDVEVFGPHSEPSGDFPNVPGHVSNPERPVVFDAMIEQAKADGHDLCVATDPDCDRIGLAAPVTYSPSPAGGGARGGVPVSAQDDPRVPNDQPSPNPSLQGRGDSQWKTLTGNQICALLSDYALEHYKGQLTPEHFVMCKRWLQRSSSAGSPRPRAPSASASLLVGFKWIAEAIDEYGPEKFVFGSEESHGYMTGTYARDKDGAVAAMLACELAAKLKADGQTLHQKLESLFWQHGAHAERLVNVQMPGSEGMARMQEVMAAFRSAPPESIGGMPVTQRRDYLEQKTTKADGSTEPIARPHGNLIILDMATSDGEEGNYVACRPSGTEPKIKFYMFTYTPGRAAVRPRRTVRPTRVPPRRDGSRPAEVCWGLGWVQVSGLVGCGLSRGMWG